jgi:PHD/YefM family antitoxin component YafN of YafNO toxin-antitoxin module
MHIPQIEPVTNLSKAYKLIFAKLDNGPVILAMRSRPAAVLLSVSDYEKLVTRLK